MKTKQEDIVQRLIELVERSEARIDRTNEMICTLVTMSSRNEDHAAHTVDTLNRTVGICHDLQRQLAEAQKEIERTLRNFEEIMKAYIGCLHAENNFNIGK